MLVAQPRFGNDDALIAITRGVKRSAVDCSSSNVNEVVRDYTSIIDENIRRGCPRVRSSSRSCVHGVLQSAPSSNLIVATNEPAINQLVAARLPHTRCPSSRMNVAKAGIQLAGAPCIRQSPTVSRISHLTWRPTAVQPPSDLIRNGRKTMRASGPNDGLGIKWLFSQGLGRYTAWPGLFWSLAEPRTYGGPHGFVWKSCFFRRYTDRYHDCWFYGLRIRISEIATNIEIFENFKFR